MNRVKKNLLLFINQIRQTVFFLSALFFMTILCHSNVTAQNRNALWCFGDSAGLNFIDTANVTTFSTGLDTRGTCVSIADINGNLLFYAGTRAGISITSTLVFNRNNVVMENGDSIIGEGWYNELQIIPFPNDSMKYYLFSVSSAGNLGVFYSIIDLNENGGDGKVIQKNILLGSYKVFDATASYKNGNGRDWWYITKVSASSPGNNIWHVYSITPNGITDSVQTSGLSEAGGLGNLVFYNSGSKLLFSSFQGLVETMEFDRCIGVLSNTQIITNGSSTRYVGSAVSANDQILYLSTNYPTSYLYQLDLNAPNIFNSRIVIDTISYPTSSGGLLRLAPNNKIYWGIFYTDGHYPYHDNEYTIYNMNLSVINTPDVLGFGCNFSRFSTYLNGKRAYFGLPNNPFYEAPSLSSSICDTLTSGITETQLSRSDIELYFSSSWSTLFINGKNFSGQRVNCIILNTMGQIIKRFDIFQNGGYFTESIDLGHLSTGLYLISFSDGQQTITK